MQGASTCPQPQRAARGRCSALKNGEALRQVSATRCRSTVESPPDLQSTSSRQPAQACDVQLYFRPSHPWKRAVVHGSLVGAPWTDIGMTQVHSSSGKWHRCELRAAQGSNGSAPLAEFVLTDGAGNWVKPSGGGNFTITAPGRHAVSGGTLRAINGRRVMVVSDLDGTMVGDDGSTRAFREWWEDAAVPRGGVLVYNTGRSLESFLKLQQDKAHSLAHPDALILSVGTKVFEFIGGRWVEDAGWVAQLDQGWDLGVARELAYTALAKVGKEAMHFRPPDEQNDHKVTCGVAVSAMPAVQAVLEQGFAAHGLTPNIVVSGHGDWRFVDIVPARAGKLEALKYVAQAHGFAPQEVVACGDSGNDILMLQGDNPAIIVGNAQPDLRKWYQARQAQELANGGPNGKPRLLMTSKREALGILEGLEAWGFK